MSKASKAWNQSPTSDDSATGEVDASPQHNPSDDLSLTKAESRSESDGLTLTANPNGEAAAQEHGFYQCGTCKKTYNRADHLIRHVRSHTHEKPYVCDVCGKGFARPDLLKRHAAGHDNNEDKTAAADGTTTRKRKIATVASSALMNRVTQACKACAASKLKCSEGKPCERCKKKKLVCEEASSEDIPKSSAQSEGLDDPNMTDADSKSASTAEQNAMQATEGDPSADLQQFYQANPRPGPVPVARDGVLEFNGSFYPDFLRNVLTDSGSAHTTARYDPATSANQAFFPQNFADIVPEDGNYGSSNELWYSESLQDAFRMPYESTFTSYAPVMNSGTENSSSAGVGADAFKRSLIGSWTPRPEDSSMMERRNLAAPENVDTMPIFAESQRLLHDPLSIHARDRILGMVLETCPQSSASHVIASFPSADFLSSCISYYFSRRHKEQIDSYIHLPTIDVNKQKAELLAMLVSAGAVCTASTAVRKLGYALQEAVRQALGKRFDEDNTVTRDMGILQAAWLQTEVGLWSDSRRKIELAEAYTQLNATMLRRAGKFNRTPYPAIDVMEADTGEILEKKWWMWTQQESMKRLRYHAFLHDSRASLALHITPVMSYTELSLPFPASRELWSAPNAVEWKRAFLARNFGPLSRVVGLKEALQDMSLITPCRSQIDVHYSALILLHGLWALVWEFRQLNSIGGPQSRYWNGLVLSSRHAELCSALGRYRLDSLKWGVLCPRVRTMLEVISLHLYMSLEELQLYAGKENIVEAQKVYYSARQWFDSPSSRQAVWHAGQVIRAAACYSPGSLYDGFVVAIYHASMAFWAFGVVGKSNGMPEAWLMAGPHLQRGPLIFLDEEETLDLTAFVAHSQGIPGLSGKDGRFIPLGNTPAIMDHISEVLTSNWKHGSQPPLVDSISRLVLDLGKAAKHIR